MLSVVGGSVPRKGNKIPFHVAFWRGSRIESEGEHYEALGNSGIDVTVQSVASRSLCAADAQDEVVERYRVAGRVGDLARVRIVCPVRPAP